MQQIDIPLGFGHLGPISIQNHMRMRPYKKGRPQGKEARRADNKSNLK